MFEHKLDPDDIVSVGILQHLEEPEELDENYSLEFFFFYATYLIAFIWGGLLGALAFWLYCLINHVG